MMAVEIGRKRIPVTKHVIFANWKMDMTKLFLIKSLLRSFISRPQNGKYIVSPTRAQNVINNGLLNVRVCDQKRVNQIK
jgi:hypothetical protein